MPVTHEPWLVALSLVVAIQGAYVGLTLALQVGDAWATALAVIAAVNSVVAFFYYARPIRAMWFSDADAEDRSPIRIPPALAGAIAITAVTTIVIGIYPQLFAKVGEMAF